MKKLTTLAVSVLAIGMLSGCGSNNKEAESSQSSSGSHVRTITKIQLLGNMKSNKSGIYKLKGMTNPKAKVWYHYKSGTKYVENSLIANKYGKFTINVKNTSVIQKETVIEVNAKVLGLKSNFKIVSIKNCSSAYISGKSTRDSIKADKETQAKYEKNESKAKQSSKDAKQSIRDASISRLVASESRHANSRSSTKPSYGLHYKHVSLDDFIADPYSYDGKNIKTSGTVSYIQRNPDNSTMDYVVLNDDDDTAATVTEIEVEYIHSYHVTEGER